MPTIAAKTERLTLTSICEPAKNFNDTRGLRRLSSPVAALSLNFVGRAANRYRSNDNSIGTAPVGSTSSAKTCESVGEKQD